MSEKRYVYVVEWFDTQASVIRKFYFTYYLPDHLIEMYDLKNQKIFLKKIKYPQVTLADLFIGNVFTCFNRQLKVIDYGDQFTRKQNQSKQSRTYGMIKPNAYLNIGKIISATEQHFQIGNLKMFRMTVPDAEGFYAEHRGKGFFGTLIEFMTSDFVVGMELIAGDAIQRWRDLIGPTNSLVAKEKAPKSIRALYGIDGTKNACHGSDAPETANRELNYIFSKSSKLRSSPILNHCTLCVIKPHIIKDRHLGQIIDAILTSGFEISAMQMFWLDKQTSREFFEVYEFLPEYMKMIESMMAGPCVALEVRHEDPVLPFRELCGPFDPEIARKLRPNSLRARFGVDRVRNAVHCTDLPEDGPLEVQYFFQTLTNL